MAKKRIVHNHYGMGLGTLIAVLISWSINKSVGWAILHGFFGWFYILYYLTGCAGSI